jgi:transcriptional regulator with XRE-family HTH domain
MSGTKKIGSKIAVARKKATISQAQLADRLFISP